MPYKEDILEKEGEAVEGTVEIWKHELPETNRDVSGKMILKEEKFNQYDGEIIRLAEIDGWEEEVIKGLKDKKESNNFWVMFSSTEAEAAFNGGDGMVMTSGFKPFYINARYDNAWSRMCEQFPEDIKRSVELTDGQFDREDRQMSEEEKESFSRLALYLNEQEKISAAFLWQ